MTYAIQAMKAVMPYSRLYSRHLKLWKRTSHILGFSFAALAARSGATKLRVSESWLREHEVAASKRQVD